MIYMYLAEGFEETEALATLDFIRRAEIDILTVGVTGKRVTGSHGIEVKADIELAESDVSIVDGVILPGGMPGTLNLEKSETVTETVLHCFDENKLVCAICAAPSVLGHLGILKGKCATCFPGFEEQLFDAQVVDEACVVDGNIITARGAGSVFDFSRVIITAIRGEAEAARVLKQAQCR